LVFGGVKQFLSSVEEALAFFTKTKDEIAMITASRAVNMTTLSDRAFFMALVCWLDEGIGAYVTGNLKFL
jgi:hypothetical protein